MERKVIFHVDECGRFEMAAGNIHNMCSFYRGREIPVVIELLLNGEAVRAAAAAAPEAEGCRELLREEGVEIAVCNNALRKNGIAAEELTEGVRVVPGWWSLRKGSFRVMLISGLSTFRSGSQRAAAGELGQIGRNNQESQGRIAGAGQL